MSPDQKAAYIIAQSACAMAEVAGMQAHDRHVSAVGGANFYTEEAYADVMNKYGIHHNTVIGFFSE